LTSDGAVEAEAPYRWLCYGASLHFLGEVRRRKRQNERGRWRKRGKNLS
jgi:hypothetical protein